MADITLTIDAAALDRALKAMAVASAALEEVRAAFAALPHQLASSNLPSS